MIKKFLKVISCIFMPAFIAGFIFLSLGFSMSVPKGVTLNGVDVGGMSRAEASRAVREIIEEELKEKVLIINAGDSEYSFTYPEINYKDNIYYLLKNAKKGENLTAEISYYLCGLDEVAAAICLNEGVEVLEPYAKFTAGEKPFDYFEGHDGKEIVKSKLKEDIINSLQGGFEPVNATYSGVKRKKTLEDVKKSTCLLSRFTTYYDGENLYRASNIRLAAAKLNKTVIPDGEILSFNDIVGAREKSRGFLPAKIIENGEFTEGVGGGVCQVSTTLYNAAVLSGLKIEEYHPHSLPVGYVPPSRDAMVSGTSCDLKIKNLSGYPVYICARTGKNYVTFEFYGMECEEQYSISSEVTGVIAAPEESTDDPEKAREGKDGLTSESYITVTRGNYKKTTILRKDKYLPVKKLVYSGEEEEENTEDNGELTT